MMFEQVLNKPLKFTFFRPAIFEIFPFSLSVLTRQICFANQWTVFYTMKTLAFNELICFFIFNVSSYELILLVKSSKKVNQSRPGTQPLFLYVLLSLWATPLLTIPPKSLIVVNSLKLKINFLMYGNVDRSFTFDKPLPCRFSTYKKCSSCNICIIANSCYDVTSILKY